MITIRLFHFLIMLVISKPAFFAYAQTPLDKYFTEVFQNSLLLQKKKIATKQYDFALKIAAAYILSSVEVIASYTYRAGRRSIYIPVGDFLNRVYATFNTHAKSNKISDIENAKKTFFTLNFYDLKVLASMPVVYFDIIIGRKIMAFKGEVYKEDNTARFNSLFEWIDTPNQLAQEELQLNLSQYRVLSSVFRLERETASFNF